LLLSMVSMTSLLDLSLASKLFLSLLWFAFFDVFDLGSSICYGFSSSLLSFPCFLGSFLGLTSATAPAAAVFPS